MNSFEGNSNANVGANSGVSNATSSNSGPTLANPTGSNSSTTPVNPYAPSGAPYAPGSNTPAPSYASPSQSVPYTARTWSSPATSPAVPNTAGNDTFMSITPAPEKPKFFTKKFIIFLIIGIVLIIATIIAAVIIRSSRQGNNTPPSSQQEATVRELANLLVSGNRSTDVPNLDTPTWYATELLVSARDENASVVNSYISEIRSLVSALPDGGISSYLNSYASCLAMDHYESTEVANSCLSSADSLKTATKEMYHNISEAKS